MGQCKTYRTTSIKLLSFPTHLINDVLTHVLPDSLTMRRSLPGW